MPMIYFLAIVLAIGVAAYIIGRGRAAAQTGGAQKQHSRPHYHGWWAFMLAALPALLLIIVWSVGSSLYMERHVEAQLPEQTADSPIASRSLALGMVKSLANALRRLDAQALDNLPATFAELQRRSPPRARRSHPTRRIT
jgi:phosphate transport system permease protein